MTLVKAVYDVLGADRVRKVKIEFTIGQGYYCKVDMDEKLSLKHVRQISEKNAGACGGGLANHQEVLPD